MNLIDSHTHLYLPEFDKDRDEVIQRALERGVNKMLLPNIDCSTLDGVLSMSRTYPGVCYPMAGLHPTSVKENFMEELAFLEKSLHDEQYIAVGEIGMDLYWDRAFRIEQEEALKIQIAWTRKNNLPVVIHCRDAFNEIFEVMDKIFYAGLKGVFHSFTGTREDVKKIREYDFYFGINGIVTFKNSGLSEVVQEIPPDRILVETDSPFLSPVPKRGKRNESAHLIYITEKLADIYGMKLDEFESLLMKNTKKLFNKLQNE